MANSDKISSIAQVPDDRTSVHNNVLRASKDRNFVSMIVKQIDALRFSVFKSQILEFIKNNGLSELTFALPNPLRFLFWFLRRKENDVADFYRFVTEYVKLATGTNSLNFGYWEEGNDLVQAQKNICIITGRFGNLDTAKKVIDLGSGLSDPAIQWSSKYQSIDKIVCVDVNYYGLRKAKKNICNYLKTLNYKTSVVDHAKILSMVNATATRIPFPDDFADRIVALESAQHFKPFAQFVAESYRVLKSQGLLILAIPVLTLNDKRRSKNINIKFLRELRSLGVLSLTWASEHYELSDIRSVILKQNFKIRDIDFIGPSVYDPLADYYSQNRKVFQKILTERYRSYWQKIILHFVERIVYRSALKMKACSEKGIIDYVLIKAER